MAGEDNVELTSLFVSPTSYTFVGLKELTSISIESEDPEYTFERANDLGSGLVSLDKETKILTSEAYGKARYRIIAEKPGKNANIIYLDFEVARPNLGTPDTIECYVDINTGYGNIEYEPPEGYVVKLIEPLELKTPIANVTEYLTVTPEVIGDQKYVIVLEKEDPEDFEEDLEWVGCYVNLHVYELRMNPNTSGIFTKLRQTFNIESIQAFMGSNQKPAELSFRVTQSGDGKYFDVNVIEIPDKDYDYMLDVTGLEPGDGLVEVVYKNDFILHRFTVEVVDDRSLVLSNPTTNYTLKYGESVTIEKIYYDDNETNIEITAIGSTNYPFDFELTETDPDKHIYSLTITNNADRGGEGYIYLKPLAYSDDNFQINIKCLKEVKESKLTVSPVTDPVILNVGRTFTFVYVSALESDDIIVENQNENVVAARLQPLESEVYEPDQYGDMVPVEFPQWSTQKVLYLVGQNDGETDIILHGIVNETDITCTYRFTVKTLPADKLPDETSIVNLYAPNLPVDRSGDIIIDLPEESSTLTLKEKLDAAMIVEFGYSYDYVSDTNPSVDTDPEPFTNTSGNATWLNNTTGEVFICLDDTAGENIWYGNKGTFIGTITYPNPGEKGFGVGPAPKDVAKEYNMEECEGCWDRNSDNYGNYYDAFNNKFVFVPVHCIIPITDPDLSNVYPYDGMRYEFSWVMDAAKFTRYTIPRCFINNGHIQPGIFISKYNGEIQSDGYVNKNKHLATEYISSGSNVDSLYPVYRTNNTAEKDDHVTVSDLASYPELRMMAKAIVPIDPIREPAIGRHNMSIFVQTMLANLGDLHTIASYEKSASDKVCGKLKYLVSGTWCRETEIIDGLNNETQRYKQEKEFFTGVGSKETETIHYSNGTGSIKRDYRMLYSHNGQENGVFDINGPSNVGLTGILVVQDDPDLPNNYKVYALKDSLDIAEIESSSFNTIRESNTKALIFKTPIFNLDNYDLINTIRNNEEINKVLYLNPQYAYITHDADGNSLLYSLNVGYRSNLHAGLNTDTLNDFTSGQYVTNYNNPNDTAMRNSKYKGSVFNMGYAGKISTIRDAEETWYGFFTANYTPTGKEITANKISSDEVYNGYRTRVARYVGQMKYLTKSNSEYMLGYRVCVTPHYEFDYVNKGGFYVILDQFVEKGENLMPDDDPSFE